jgi:hypothetical protein
MTQMLDSEHCQKKLPLQTRPEREKLRNEMGRRVLPENVLTGRLAPGD